MQVSDGKRVTGNHHFGRRPACEFPVFATSCLPTIHSEEGDTIWVTFDNVNFTSLLENVLNQSAIHLLIGDDTFSNSSPPTSPMVFPVRYVYFNSAVVAARRASFRLYRAGPNVRPSSSQVWQTLYSAESLEQMTQPPPSSPPVQAATAGTSLGLVGGYAR
jgi:hypothetical protein